MFQSSKGIARFLFRLNIVPGALSLICVLIPQPFILLLMASGLYLLYGYWRIARDESPGVALTTFWLASMGANVVGVISYVLVMGGELNKIWVIVVMSVGVLWTLGTAFVSWQAYRFTATSSSSTETVS